MVVLADSQQGEGVQVGRGGGVRGGGGDSARRTGGAADLRVAMKSLLRRVRVSEHTWPSGHQPVSLMRGPNNPGQESNPGEESPAAHHGLHR